jgi:hypothetical protein
VLDIKVRFHGWVENGLLKRIEEMHDARYIEVYERFVFHIVPTAEVRGRRMPRLFWRIYTGSPSSQAG